MVTPGKFDDLIEEFKEGNAKAIPKPKGVKE
jgi:hypothetical protein